MKQNLNIEAEGSELILKNKAGDYVIIPKKYRTEVQGMIKDGCHGCIDALVETLPVMADYAEDGSLYSEYLTNDPPTKKSTKHPLDPNPDGSLPSYFKGSAENPILFDEVTVVAEAPQYDNDPERIAKIKRQIKQGWDKIKSTVKDIARPIYHKYKKLTTPDYTDKGDRDAAYAAARKAGETEFMWNNQRFNTKYDGTSEQQLKETGITDEQLQNRNFIQERLGNNLAPVGYDNITSRLFNAVVMNKKDAINYISNSRLDAYNLYVGKPQTNNTFSISRYIPSKSKDKNVIYYSLNNDEFKDRLINLVNEEEDIAKYLKFIVDKDLPSSRESVMGKFFLSVSEDNNGKYIAYYDKWDLNPLNLKVPFTNKEIPTDFGKPFEIYDRIYYRDNPNYNKELFNQLNNKLKYTENLKTEYDSYGNYVYRDIDNNIVTLPNNISYLIDYQNELKDKIKNFPKKYIRQYYSDKELSELDINKRNFDTLALQRELSNRGYKLPKSTKKDGAFDGIWGDETKAALLDYQTKNKKNNDEL